MKATSRAYVAGLGMALLFGLSFLAAKVALAACGRVLMLALRFTVAGVALWALKLTGVVPASYAGKPWWKLVVLSLFYPTLSFVLEAAGVDLLPSSQAGIIMALMPVIALVMGVVLLGERVSAVQVAMVATSVVGVALTALATASDGQDNLLGMCLMLGCALLGAIQTISVRGMSDTFSAFEVTCVMSAVAAVVFDIYALATGAFVGLPAVMGDISGIGSVVYLALGCSVGAFFCLNYVNAHLPVARGSVFTNLSTVVSIVAGVLLGGDELSVLKVAGMALILLGVWGVNGLAPKEGSSS